MRQNLRDKAKSIEINCAQEMKRIDSIFTGTQIIEYHSSTDYMGLYPKYTTISNIFDAVMFSEYPYSETFISLEDMRISLGISDKDIKNNDVDTMLDYFEWIYNILAYFLRNYTRYNFTLIDSNYANKIIKNIQIILERLNYELKEIDGYFVIYKKDSVVSAIAELYPDISYKTLEYRRHGLSGDIDRKCEILNSLANKFEAIRPTLKANNFSEIEDKVGSLLNNLDIRHNNVIGKNAKDIVKNMSNEELEQWYDKTYDLLLMCFMFNNYLSFRDDIKDLNKNLKNKV